MFVALVIESVVFAFWCLALKRQVRGPKWTLIPIAVAVLVFFVCIGAGGESGLWISSVVLFVGALVSMARNADVPRWVVALRLLIIVLGVVIGIARAVPSNRKTDELIDVAAYVIRFNQTNTWIFRELAARPDTRDVLERELTFTESDNVVALHAQLNFPVEGRRAACQRLRIKDRQARCPSP